MRKSSLIAKTSRPKDTVRWECKAYSVENGNRAYFPAKKDREGSCKWSKSESWHCGRLPSYRYWSSAPCLLLSHTLPILCSLCHFLLIDHQPEIRGWFPLETIMGMQSYCGMKDAVIVFHSIYSIPTLQLKDSLLPITTHGGLSTCWRPVTSLEVANFPKCLTICSVLLTTCLCCQSHGRKKIKALHIFVNGICWDDINHTDRELSIFKWMYELNTRAVNGLCFWSLLS